MCGFVQDSGTIDNIFNYRYYNFLKDNLILSNKLLEEVDVFLTDRYIMVGWSRTGSYKKLRLLLLRSVIHNIKFSPRFQDELGLYGFSVDRADFIGSLEKESRLYECIGIKPIEYCNLVKKLLIFLRNRGYVERAIIRKQGYPLTFSGGGISSRIKLTLKGVKAGLAIFDDVTFSTSPYKVIEYKGRFYSESNSFRSITPVMHNKLCNKANDHGLSHIRKLNGLGIKYVNTDYNLTKLNEKLESYFRGKGVNLPLNRGSGEYFGNILDSINSSLSVLKTKVDDKYLYQPDSGGSSLVGSLRGCTKDGTRPPLSPIKKNEVRKLLNERDDLKDLKHIVLQNTLFIKALTLNTPVYFPHILDFRGRFYPYSIIGLTGSRILRATATFSGSEPENRPISTMEGSSFFKAILRLGDSLNLFSTLDYTKEHRYYVYVILIEVGKVFKSEMLSIGSYTLSMTLFIKGGFNRILTDS